MQEKTISFDLWSVYVIQKLLLKKGLILPSFFILRDEWIPSITAQVRSVVPIDEWQCEEKEINAVIAKRMFEIIQHITTNFVKSVFTRAWIKTSRPLPDEGVVAPGEYEIYFFLLSHLAKNGYLGTMKEAKSFLIAETNANYHEETHKENVEALFL